MNAEIFVEVLRNSILITGLVLIMMLMIEYFNIHSQGKWLCKLQGSKFKQILLASFLGLIPGCVGGFAAVSLFTHRLISFGALVAMMICSSGDEAFVILALIPGKALLLFGLLLVIAVVTGLAIDTFIIKKPVLQLCPDSYTVHSEHDNKIPSIFKASSYRVLRHPSKERIALLAGIAVFIAAVAGGLLEHRHVHGEAGHLHETTASPVRKTTEPGHRAAGAGQNVPIQEPGHPAHSSHPKTEKTVRQGQFPANPVQDRPHDGLNGGEVPPQVYSSIFTPGHTPERKHEHEHERDQDHGQDQSHRYEHDPEQAGLSHPLHLDFLSERWINLIFAILSIVTLLFTATASEHFIKEHLWNHVIRKHLLSIFLWTFGALLVCQIGIQYLDVQHWISRNMLAVVLLAVAIGVIPESGPHLIFITLYAQGVLPFYVLLVNSVVQDGHTTLPLLAESKSSFFKAKLVNMVVGLMIGLGGWLLS